MRGYRAVINRLRNTKCMFAFAQISSYKQIYIGRGAWYFCRHFCNYTMTILQLVCIMKHNHFNFTNCGTKYFCSPSLSYSFVRQNEKSCQVEVLSIINQ